MGRKMVVDFRRWSIDDYYICKMCGRHIALQQDFDFIDKQDNEELGGIFTTVYNVKVDEANHHYQVGPYTVADIYCFTCKDKLGYKYIRVGSGTTRIRKDNVKLIMGKLFRSQFGELLVDMATLETLTCSEDDFVWIIRDT